MYGLSSREALSKRQAGWVRAISDVVSTPVETKPPPKEVKREPLITMLSTDNSFPSAFFAPAQVPPYPPLHNVVHDNLKLMYDDLLLRHNKLEQLVQEQETKFSETLVALNKRLDEMRAVRSPHSRKEAKPVRTLSSPVKVPAIRTISVGKEEDDEIVMVSEESVEALDIIASMKTMTNMIK